MKNMQELEHENIELKKALYVLMNKALIKKLSEAFNRINNGDYVSEEEFFNDSPQENA